MKKARGGKGYEESLLSFYAMLDPAEDTYFLKAIEPDVAAIHDAATRRAQELMNGALASWRQYRRDGAIGGEQRLESEISGKFPHAGAPAVQCSARKRGKARASTRN
ncbi:hypothetical protein ACU4GD_32775 [Cupriavidus basilensis]